jgi:AcrR family transcriptional regulator
MNTPPKYTRLDAQQRRDQILDAANALFAERTYGEVTVEDIASSAGVTRGLVHHHFGGCKEVYIGLLERLGAVREQQLTLARLDRGEPHDLACHDRARGGHRRPRRQARYRRPRAPRRRAARRPSRGHRRGLATAALRARLLDRPQPRCDAPLATRRSNPRGNARTARLDARARPTHVWRSTQAKPSARIEHEKSLAFCEREVVLPGRGGAGSP